MSRITYYKVPLKILLPINQVYGLRANELSKFQELIELFSLSLLSFFIPIILGGPQLLVGIVVNLLIVRQSLTQRGWKAAPTILLPSMGALARGILLGGSTKYLIVVVPFIWLGNFIISYLSKLFLSKTIVSRIVFPSVLKTLAIFLPAIFLVQFSVLPKSFIISMGAIQLVTALIGSAIAIALTTFQTKK
ncbi:MAG: hypothetical protein PHS44_01310 [Candidatus Dojkabacteria bacterium]|jgi:hypothetical protein|nr:hypothetical protein [Candidatus Dojkabacteria bacterium]